jgi:hypothetical protein
MHKSGTGGSIEWQLAELYKTEDCCGPIDYEMAPQHFPNQPKAATDEGS